MKTAVPVARQVFISYAREDSDVATRLYQDLKDAGLSPWIDTEKLIGGQKWRPAVIKALRSSSFCLALLSSRAVSKRGYVQKELREALNVLDEMPEDRVFLIPVRIDECVPSHPQLSELQWVDLFPSYHEGLRRILQSLSPDERLNDDHVSKAQPRQVVGSSGPPSSLDEFLKLRSVQVRAEIKSKLSAAGRNSVLDYHIVANLWLETRLPRRVWAAIVDGLLNASPNPDAVRGVVAQAFHAYHLCGPAIHIAPRPACLTIVRVGSLIRRHSLLNGLSFKYSRSAILEFANGCLTEAPDPLGDVTISQYVQWCTFDPDGGTPFRGESEKAEYYAANLGYPVPVSGEKLMALHYKPPRGLTLRFPTICDAGVAIGFRPAPPLASWGLAVPWTSDPTATPRPEAVHKPLTLAAVSAVRLLE